MSKQTATHIHADPAAIPALVALRDATRIQAAIRDGFGFEASLVYCAALVAFVDAQAAHIARIAELEARLSRLEPSPEDVEAMFI